MSEDAGHRQQDWGGMIPVDGALSSNHPWRWRTFTILERGAANDYFSRFVNAGLAALIVVNLVAMALETVPSLMARHATLFWTIEYISLVVFTVEYAAIVWVAVEQPPLRHLPSWLARFHYMKSAAGIVDLLSVLPFWFALFLHVDLRALLIFRLLRFMKLTRHSTAIRGLLAALYAERRALLGCLVIMAGATLIAGTIMHVVEGDIQPDKFGTIPHAMWWAIVTLGTVGYGDVVPITLGGRLVASGVIMTSFIMMALPVGIIATAFAEQVHRRNFVVTWGMITRVPLFAGFQARHVVDIMEMLKAQSVAAGEVIARRGDEAHSMYFITSGKVEIELPDKTVELGVGHFFGEVAVLKQARRSATVTALTRCDLLVLEARDLRGLMEREPTLAMRVNEVMAQRIGGEVVGQTGDMIREEVEDTLSNPVSAEQNERLGEIVRSTPPA